MDGMRSDPITMRKGAASLKIGTTRALPLRMRSRVLEISHVECQPERRGTGEASRLMEEACAAADRAGKLLILSIEPYEDGPLNILQLSSWYGKYGFVVIQQATDTVPEIMAREARQAMH